MASVTRIDRSDLGARNAAQAARARSDARAETWDARRDRAHFTLAERQEDVRQAARAEARDAPPRRAERTPVPDRSATRPVPDAGSGARATRADASRTQALRADAARESTQEPTTETSAGETTGPATPAAGADVRRSGAEGPRAAAARPTTGRTPGAGRISSAGGSQATNADEELATAPNEPGSNAVRPAAGKAAATGEQAGPAEGRGDVEPEPAEPGQTAEPGNAALPPSPVPPPSTVAPDPGTDPIPVAVPSAAADAVEGHAKLGEARAKAAALETQATAPTTSDSAGTSASDGGTRAEPGAFASLLAAEPAAPGRPRTVAAPAEPARTQHASATGAATPLRAVPIEIGLRALDGTDRFDIRLDPDDLGRIEVRLDIDRDKREVKAHLTVDRIETLQLLQRDASLLEQAFVQAGLTPSSDGLAMTLRDPGDGQNGTSQDGGSRGGRPTRSNDPIHDEAPVARLTVRPAGGLDIRI